jgi:hypothetical protein
MWLVPICASPFLSHGLPSSTSDCKTLPRCPSCCFSSFSSVRHSVSHHTTCSILRSTVRRQVWSTSFPFPWVAIFVTYSRLYNAAHVDCDIAKFKKTHVLEHQTLTFWPVFEVICSSICHLFEHLSDWATLTGMNLCRVELPWPVRFVSGSAILTGTNLCGVEPPWPAGKSVGLGYLNRHECLSVEQPWPARIAVGVELFWPVRIYVRLSFHDRFEYLPSWPILTEHFHGFPQSLKTTAGHRSNYITIVSFKVPCTLLLITLRIDVSVNYCQRHYRNHNLEQTHSYT